MKKYIYSAIIALATVSAMQSCKKDTPSQEIQNVEQVAADATIFALDKESSNIEWKGYKIFKSESTSHFGDMKFVEGEIGVKDGQVVSGKFIADMSTIETKDIEDPKSAQALDNHLKNKDFFEVEKFPTATFELVKVSSAEQGDFNSVLEGNMTIKGVTHPMKFNANVKVDTEQISIFTEPTDFDRSLYKVEFQSPVENGVLKNEITLQISVKAQIKK